MGRPKRLHSSATLGCNLSNLGTASLICVKEGFKSFRYLVQQQTIPTETMSLRVRINPNVPAQEPELNLLIADKQFEEPSVQVSVPRVGRVLFSKETAASKAGIEARTCQGHLGFLFVLESRGYWRRWILRFARHRHRAYRLLGRRIVAAAAPAQKVTVTLARS